MKLCQVCFLDINAVAFPGRIEYMAYAFIETTIATHASKFLVYKSGLQRNKQFDDEISVEFM
jgi:hypothetical protein